MSDRTSTNVFLREDVTVRVNGDDAESFAIIQAGKSAEFGYCLEIFIGDDAVLDRLIAQLQAARQEIDLHKKGALSVTQ